MIKLHVPITKCNPNTEVRTRDKIPHEIDTRKNLMSYRGVATNENKIKEPMDNFVASQIKDLFMEDDK